mmetsp:Transcript_18836/g.47851  ORF Transcript_18836/g.47851 Transcript_18836/m.47851 type:complete len:262 (-) Transcript_18836:9-794(-)
MFGWVQRSVVCMSQRRNRTIRVNERKIGESREKGTVASINLACDTHSANCSRSNHLREGLGRTALAFLVRATTPPLPPSPSSFSFSFPPLLIADGDGRVDEYADEAAADDEYEVEDGGGRDPLLPLLSSLFATDLSRPPFSPPPLLSAFASYLLPLSAWPLSLSVRLRTDGLTLPTLPVFMPTRVGSLFVAAIPAARTAFSSLLPPTPTPPPTLPPPRTPTVALPSPLCPTPPLTPLSPRLLPSLLLPSPSSSRLRAEEGG